MKSLPTSTRGHKYSSLVEVSQPTKSFDSIIINANLRRSLERLKDEWSLREVFARNGLKPRNRLLFHGPPGNGKTMAAQCLAGLFELPLLTVRCENLVDKWLGESEKNAAAVFEDIEAAPCVAFFDEADSFFSARTTAAHSADAARNNMVNITLQRLDRLKPTSIVIGATNRFEDLDKAIIRRFDSHYLFDSPTDEEKQEYLRRAIASKPIFKGQKKASEQAMLLDAKSFAELELEINDLAREIVIQKHLK